MIIIDGNLRRVLSSEWSRESSGIMELQDRLREWLEESADDKQYILTYLSRVRLDASAIYADLSHISAVAAAAVVAVEPGLDC